MTSISTGDTGSLNNIPVLRYLKDPATIIDELYERYPLGGEYGWYAFITSKQTFAYWDTDNSKWALLSEGDLQTMLGIDPSLLAEGDIPIWDGVKFYIMSFNLFGTEEY